MKKKCKPNCSSCDNCVALGEGDFVCFECGGSLEYVISDYQPTEKYLQCRGKKFKDGET